MSIVTHSTTKTSINLYSSIKDSIDYLAQKKIIKNQTDFINKTLQSALEEIEREQIVKKLKKQMKNIKRVKSKLSSEQSLREVRNESMDIS